MNPSPQETLTRFAFREAYKGFENYSYTDFNLELRNTL